MLGHVAQSVGAALPGIGVRLFPIVGQVQLLTRGSSGSAGSTRDIVAIPSDAAWAFAEVLGYGGAVASDNRFAGAGAAGSDAILAVSPASSIVVLLPETSSFDDAIIQLDGSVVVTAASIKSISSNFSQAGASGKYPGGSSSGSTPGKGGGRLAGASPTAEDSTTGYGSGARGGTGRKRGGLAVACITFFRTREDTVDFANLCYGGNWRP